MAITGPLLILSIFSSLLLLPSSSSSAATTTAFSGDVHHTDGFARARSVDRRAFGLKKEKLSHLHFYWHDVQSGPRPSSVTVVPAPSNSSATFFGLINMIDNALTMRPEPNSTLVGRSQGLYASASQEYVGLLMVMNFAFLEGKYNGSTVTVLGRNPVFNPMREMAVIGGSGLFRFARGYAQASTHAFDPSSGDAVVEYNVYVLHY